MEKTTLTNEEIAQKLKDKFQDFIVEAIITYDMLTLTILPEANIEVLRFLRDEDGISFHFLTDLCGVHYPFQKDKELGVVYHLHNMPSNRRIRVKSFIPSADPVIRTAIPLWNSANWMERETYDFYGILFENHPDLRRILNVDEMDYFPMLKQYPLEDATRDDKNDSMFGR